MQKPLVLQQEIQPALVAGIPRFLSIEDLSLLLGRSVQTLRNQLVRLKDEPELLPKPFSMPGSRLLRWHQGDVADFMSRCSGRLIVLDGVKQPAMTPPRRKRGRPTKSDQVARRTYETEANGGQGYDVQTESAPRLRGAL